MAKSAAEHAQALVDSAQNKVNKLGPKHEAAEAKATKAIEARDALKASLDSAKAELAHAKTHPALAGGAAQVAAPRTEAEVDKGLEGAGLTVGDDANLPQAEERPAVADASKGDLFDQEDPFAG